MKISSCTVRLTSMDVKQFIHSRTSANISITPTPFSICLEGSCGIGQLLFSLRVCLVATHYFPYLVIHSKIFNEQQQALSYLYSQVKFGAHILHRTKPETQQKSGVNRLLQDQSSSVTGITVVNKRFFTNVTKNRNTSK